MESAFLSRFTDIIVYLIPGLLVLLSGMSGFNSGRLMYSYKDLGIGELILGALTAYLIGLLTFRLSYYTLIPLEWYFDQGALIGIIKSFPKLDLLKNSMDQKFGNLQNIVEYYRYADVLVTMKAPNNAQEADRLMALSLLCRNLLVCIPISLILLTKYLKNKFGWKGLTIALLVSGLLEYGFVKAFLLYWSAAVWEFLRSYMVWQSIH